MNATREHPLVALLLTIAHSAPQPWDHKAHSQQVGIDPERLDELLEWLYLEGLIDKSAAGAPAGIVLTPLGQQVVRDADALHRLRSGVPVAAGQGGTVRNSLRRPVKPVATRALLIANFLVFAYCLYLAHNAGLTKRYLVSWSDPEVAERVWHPGGGVSVLDVIDGSWWRLLTACFVHGGVLHILMNMYALHTAGGFAEQTWGRWRYLLIYLVAGWGGSCLALAQLQTVVGASGALCGVLAAEAVWVFLNSRHLPRTLARRGQSQILWTALIMVGISIIPGVSGWGHLGGALAGGAAALVLHFQRFGPRVVRWLAGPVLLLVPVASFLQLQNARATKPAWQALERDRIRIAERAFKGSLGKEAAEAVKGTSLLHSTDVEDLRQMHSQRRDPARVRSVIAALEKQRQSIQDLLGRIERDTGLPPDNETREKAVAGLRASQQRCEQSIEFLRGGGTDSLAESAGKAMDRALRLCETDVQQLREGPRRDPKKVEAVIASLQEQQQAVADLLRRIEGTAAAVPEAALAREKAVAGLRASQELCQEAIAYLRADKGRDDKALQQKFGNADDRKNDWDSLDVKSREKLK